MKQTTFFLILFVGFVIIGLVGKLISKESFMPTESSFFDRMYRSIGIIMPIILFLVLSRYNYNTDISESNRKKNHIPCIDSTMELDRRTKSEEIWRSKSYNENSIRHQKEIDIDMNGIYSEKDYVINVPLDRTLVLETRLPGMILNRKINHRLLATADYFKRDKVEKIKLDSTQADSVLKAWGYPLSYNCK